MRIFQNQPTSALKKSSKKSPSSGTSAHFSLDSAQSLSDAPAAGGLGGVSSVGDISSLLALQGPQVDQRREGAVRQGYDTLDALDALKIDVLSGQVSRHKLLQLTSIIEKQRSDIGDPALKNVLDHIELRARVELAKFEQQAA
ncbi:MAG: flagellar assembly protein FliX [Hyphomicrobiaceae bacterium]|nr:flagellar assembly protein FliX [Hyphomicrobiaceae bacterium]